MKEGKHLPLPLPLPHMLCFPTDPFYHWINIQNAPFITVYKHVSFTCNLSLSLFVSLSLSLSVSLPLCLSPSLPLSLSVSPSVCLYVLCFPTDPKSQPRRKRSLSHCIQTYKFDVSQKRGTHDYLCKLKRTPRCATCMHTCANMAI